MRSSFKYVVLLAVAIMSRAQAQDTRTAMEPVFPATCTILSAKLAIVSGEPTSETTFDTSRVQTALNSCPAGQGVELQAAAGYNAFLIQPINIPSGVTLIVDGGVTVFATRNPADYQKSGGETCGTIGTKGGGCNPLITVNSGQTSSGSGLMGYGLIDGRGNEDLIVGGVVGTQNWWDITTSDSTSRTQNKPVILNASAANKFSLYKVTFRNAPYFNVQWSGDGFTTWGVKIIAPGYAPNTDGIDPSGSNITITKSFISDGDDQVAVKAGNPSSNITVSNLNTYSGHGISVGSQTNGGLTNMLVTNINQYGDGLLGGSIGLRLKSDAEAGGLVQNVTYQNICSTNVDFPIVINPDYDSRTGTKYPSFQNIVYRNYHSTTNGKYQFQGLDSSHISTVTFDNVVLDGLTQSHITPAMQYLAMDLGPGPVTPLLTTQTGTNVSYTGAVTNPTIAPYSCSASNFQFLTGELYISSAANNLQTLNATAPATFTLNAILEPTKSQVSYLNYQGNSYVGVPAPSSQVVIYEGSTSVGSAYLSANGTLASVTLSGVSAGTHTYTAKYLGDTTYPAYSFGSVTVSVASMLATSTALTASPSPSQYGATTTLTATVSATSGTPTGTVTFLDSATPIGATGLNGAAASITTQLGGGSHMITASYGGDASFAASISNAVSVPITKAPSTIVVIANPATTIVGATCALSVTVSGVTGAAVPSGAATFYDGTALLGTVTLDAIGNATYTATFNSSGTHALTATYSGDSNYATSQNTATVSVNGLATTTSLAASPSTISSGSSIALTATVSSSSGAPTGTITFMSGPTILGTRALVNGVATLSTVAGSPGTYFFTASYAATSTFAASVSNVASVIVTAIATTTRLAASPTTAFVGGVTTLTATVSSISGAPSGSVNFLSGAIVLGSSTLINGVANMNLPTNMLGTLTLTASYTANGNYSGSVSVPLALVVGAPFTVAATPNTISLAAGASGTVALSAAQAPGFTGTITYSCSTSVSYITCNVSPASGTSSVATIAVAASVTRLVVPVTLGQPLGAWFAIALPLGLLGLSKHRQRRCQLGLLLILVVMGAVGCGGGITSTTPTIKLPPAGAQMVTITASTVAGGITSTQAIPITVNVTN